MFTKPRVLVVTELSKKSGLGNLKRSSTICNELSKYVVCSLLVISDEVNLNDILISESFPMRVVDSIDSFSYSHEEYTHVLIDVGSLNLKEFIKLVKRNDLNTKIVALDYFFDSRELDLRISIFDQDSRLFTSNDDKHLIGLKYAVIDDLPEISTHENSLSTIVVRFSGENPNFVGKAKKILESIDSLNSIKIEYLNNSDGGIKQPRIIPRLDYLEMVSNSNLIICSGVTTLLECSILKVPTIFVGSNDLETNFGLALSKNKKITSVDGLSNNFERELMSILLAVDFNGINEFLVPNLELDFKGKHRIIDAILSL
jgi:spore coat polysaccharide biosynthesis predicted glycosyltransferase SpsG